MTESISYEDFLRQYDGMHAEWVDGQVQVCAPVTCRHQQIVIFLATLVQAVAEETNAGEVFILPFQMWLPELQRGREPDVLFVATEHRSRLGSHYLKGPAGLVMEVSSPEIITLDSGEKRSEYERAGVPEYWLIDPNQETIAVYQLGSDGRYTTAFVGHSGEYESRVLPGLRLTVNWLWQDPLPKQRDVRRELGLP